MGNWSFEKKKLQAKNKKRIGTIYWQDNDEISSLIFARLQILRLQGHHDHTKTQKGKRRDVRHETIQLSPPQENNFVILEFSFCAELTKNK